MPWFGRQPAPIGAPAAVASVIGKMFDPVAVLAALNVATPDYLGRVDRSELIYPPCTRTLTDKAGDVRSIWDHTRIEAMRYVMMVPRREVELLVDPARQTQMIEAFLRRRPGRGASTASNLIDAMNRDAARLTPLRSRHNTSA
jgi:hypothetical protein